MGGYHSETFKYFPLGFISFTSASNYSFVQIILPLYCLPLRMVWLVLISEFLISISSGPKKNISLFRRLGSNLICGFLIFICLKKIIFLSLQGPNLICGANERNFVQQQMTSWQTARGENQEIFSPKLFIKTTNSISDERVRISIFYPRAVAN